MKLDRPIVVLGAARSGTTLLANSILARHPDVAYWGEPQHVWRYGHAYHRHDVLFEHDATTEIRRHIRHQFAQFLERQGGTRFMEKTPQNCLRMPFVLAVLPEAKVVHVLRDGRDVAISAAKDWSGRGRGRTRDGIPPPTGKLARIRRILQRENKLRERVSDAQSLIELPAYAGRLLNVWNRQLFHRSMAPWGPRFPGIRQVRRSFTLLETCALQWEVCVRMARGATARLPRDQYREIRYEDLVDRPREVVPPILDFLELETDERLIDILIGDIVPRQRRRWQGRLTPDERLSVENLILPTLRELGYEPTEVHGAMVRSSHAGDGASKRRTS